MILNTSRYANGYAGQIKDIHSPERPSTYIYRKFDVDTQVEYYTYTFKDGDRLDLLASLILGFPEFWHKILDINPEISDGFAIAPGTVIRIPTHVN